MTLFETVSSKEMIMNRNYNYLLVWLSITVASEGRPDGVRGCGTSEASFIPTHGNSRNNESLPIYIRAIRNGTDWSVLIWTEETFFKGFYLRVFSTISEETANGSFTDIPPESRACSSVDVCHTSSSSNRTSHEFLWTSNADFHGNVYFKATVVVTYEQGYKLLSTEEGISTPGYREENNSISIKEVYKNCGVSIGCLSQCTIDSCSHLITWKKRGEFTRFEFLAEMNQLNIGLNLYQSIAFSDDQFMGDDDAMSCKTYNGDVHFELGYNMAGRKSYRQIRDWDSDNLIVLETSVVGGVLRCSIDRKINGEGLFKLSRKWFILHAIGVVSENNLQYHTERSVSAEMVDLLANSIVTEEYPSRVLLKMHGVLMVLAWMLFAPVGIYASRFCRQSLKNRTIFGQKVWFQIHRSCMVLVVCVTAAAVIAIATDVKGLSNTNITVDYRNIHPILGIAVTCLCVTNALISLFRCAPDDKYRVVFNGLHRFFGLSSHYLSIVNIMVGTQLDRSMLPPEAGAVVYTHTAVLILFEVIHHCLRCRHDCQDKETVSISKTNDVSDSAKVSVEQVLFYTVTVLCTVSSTLVVFFLIQTR